MTPHRFANAIYHLRMDGHIVNNRYRGYLIHAGLWDFSITLASGEVSVGFTGAGRGDADWIWEKKPTDYQMAELALIL